jgi:hypothetical protein
MKTTITARDVENYLQCRFRWLMESVYHMVPKAGNKHLILHKAVRRGLDAYYREEDAVAAATAAWDQEIARIRARLDGPIPEELEDYRSLAISMVENYPTWAAENDNFEVTEVSPLLDVSLLGKGRRWITLSLRPDLLVQRHDGTFWLVIHKTRTSMPTRDQLVMEDCILTLLTALRQPGVSTAVAQTQGVMANVLRKAEIRSPRVLKSGALSKDKSQNTTPALYRAALRELGLPEDEYADILEALDPNKFNAREEFRAAPTLTDWYQTFLAAAIDDMLRAPQEASSWKADSTTCSYCPYLDVCNVRVHGGAWTSLVTESFVALEAEV